MLRVTSRDFAIFTIALLAGTGFSVAVRALFLF